ncbi:MBG domain-containing protein [Sinomicrobium soli]|uniref:MBG domain-containing protein n=1 Tax=Sinomicrobium sp. N-1-3-6 TaxID=2219864 RepID=UPI001374C7D8|nr:MBG domain-containing protein [Sinomicrobium sp. N-1-3-6]
MESFTPDGGSLGESPGNLTRNVTYESSNTPVATVSGDKLEIQGIGTSIISVHYNDDPEDCLTYFTLEVVVPKPSVILSTDSPQVISEQFSVTAVYDQEVTGFTAGDMVVTNAAVSNLQTSDNRKYTFLVIPVSDGGVTVQVPADAAVNQENDGNTASNTLSFTYDGTAPAITSVSVPPDGYYSIGDLLSFTVHYDDPVIVNTGGDTPYIDIIIGSTTRRANYRGGSGSHSLAFGYTVQAGEEDTDGIDAGSVLSLNNGIIRDEAGNNAGLTLHAVENTSGILVDALPPEVPLGLEATYGDGEVVLHWAANTDSDLAGYKVYGGTAAGQDNLLETVNAPQTSFTDRGLTNGTVHYYRISAVDHVGNEGGQTTVVQARPKGSQVITFDVLTGSTYGDAPFALTATASSGLDVNYASSDPSTASVSGNILTLHKAGTVAVTASQPGNDVYDAAPAVVQSLTIAKAGLVVTADNKTKVYGEADPELTYTTGGWQGSDDKNLLSGTLTREPGEDAGSYAITRGDLSAGANYEITFTGAALEITPADFEGITFKDGTFTYDGTAHSLYVSGTPAEATVTYTGNGQTDAGVYTVEALVTRANYNTLGLRAELTVEKALQDITFAPLPDKLLETNSDFQLQATASSGLSVRYSYTYEGSSAPATVSEDGRVILHHSGTIAITAAQEGNDNYHPATPVRRQLQIGSANAEVASIELNGERFSGPGPETGYVMDCSSFASQVDVVVQTEDPGAVVSPSARFTIETPTAGRYSREVAVTSQDGSTTRYYRVTVERMFAFGDIVEEKFGNVLLVNNNPATNGGYRFVTYEWFRDGNKIGEGQYYSAGDTRSDRLDPMASYSVRMTTDSGEVLSTCEGQVTPAAAAEMKAWPNPVLSGELLHVLADVPEAELSSGVSITVYNGSGQQVLHTTHSEKETAISLPRFPGVYLVRLQTGQRNKTFKIIVE